jgi:uncharacterized membrane protein
MKADKLKIVCALALALIGLVTVSGLVNAADVPVTIDKIKIDGDEIDIVNDEAVGGIVRGDKVEVEVKLLASADDDNLVVEASIEGLDHDTEKATAKTEAFSVKADKTYRKILSVELPDRMDATQYALRIEVSNRQDTEIVYNAVLDIENARNRIRIKDTVFSPANEVQAGRALLTTARIQNMGEDTEEDVKVTVSIPALGLSASDYIDELESEDTVTSEELYIRVPDCADAGQYKVLLTAEYDEGDEKVSSESTINVVKSDTCNVEPEGKTIITVSSDVQDITSGESGVVYPVTLTNTGNVAKTFTVSAVAGDWADVKVSPSVVVLGAGETKIVYVSVAAKEAATAGEKTFSVAIKSGETTLKEVAMKANVLEGQSGWDKVKRGLEVALVVLVILLVIIGLVIGFNKLKGNDEDEENTKGETYY